MKKYLYIVLLVGVCFGQDIIKYDGKELKGKYISHDYKTIKFKFEGKINISEFPFDRKKLEFIKLSNDKYVEIRTPATNSNDKKVDLPLRLYHTKSETNAIKYNLISYILIAPSIIKLYEPLIFALPLLPNIIDELVLQKMKKDLNLSEDDLVNLNLKSMRNRYLKKFMISNLLFNFSGYLFFSFLEGLTWT